MLKKINKKARPRIFKPAMSKSRWKSNFCVAMAVFLLLVSVSLLHTKLGVEGTDDSQKDESLHRVSKFPAARKELVNREEFFNGEGGDLDKGGGLEKADRGEFLNESFERRENLEIDEGEENGENENDDDDDVGENEMEDFDGFQDRIDELDEMEDDEGASEGNGNNLSERSSRGVERNEKGLESQGSRNGEGNEGSRQELSDGNAFSVKRLERLGHIKTVPRSNSSGVQKKAGGFIQSKKSIGGEKSKSFRGRAGLFWDHVMGVTRRAFLKHPHTRMVGGNSNVGHAEQSQFDEYAIGDDDSMAGSNEKIKEAFSSDDEPIDEGIRNGLEEVYAIEDALLLKSSDRSSPLRSGWGPWFDTIQRRASKSDFLRRDRMARSTVDLLNPLNNPLLQDPDAIGLSGLTKSDRAIQKALKKASIEGVPIVSERLFHSRQVPEEETGVEGKGQVQNAVDLQKTTEESNLDGGDEASVKERNNPENDDDTSLKTGLTQLTRKTLDESDRYITHLQSKNSGDLTETLKGTEHIHSVEKETLSHEGSRKNIKFLGKNSWKSIKDVSGSNLRRKKVPFKQQGAESKEDTSRRLRTLSASELQEFEFQDSANITLSAQITSLEVNSRTMDNNSDVTPVNNNMTEDMAGIAMDKKNRAAGHAIKNIRSKHTGVENSDNIKRPGETSKLNSAPQKRVHRKIRHNVDTRRWGYFPGLDPLLSFSDFMDEFLQDGNCSLRVFMAWTTPPWSYTVRHQRGLESLLYFHPHACVVVFSETMELDFFEDFVKDSYKVAVVMPNLDELLNKTPAHLFASVWLEWRNVDLYYIHYTELLRLAALYKYGGIYLDSDIVVLKTLDSLNNTIGTEFSFGKEFILNGAVMAFEQHSPFLLECLKEFTATYDDTLLRWNGPELLTRVTKRFIEQNGESWVPEAFKLQPYWDFFPLSSHNISRYFTAPSNQYDKERQEVLFNRILNGSFTFHFWNNMTSKMVPESGSLVDKILNYRCLHCTDLL
uniref:Alpha 1,4-glycosyltransferase domain-containing protein n=1 Tax=Araucaria cunninghamii TaxID=56994 RepID=A0A0D6R4H8_ARACU